MIPQKNANSILNLVNSTLLNLPSPSFISYIWNFGSMLGIILIFQVIRGLLISIFYVSDTSISFYSVVHCSRDVLEGWVNRFLHINGASFLFIFIYRHMFVRGIYFKSFIINKETWISGVTLLLIFIGTAFLGYVLPWGQMSFWGATVITNIVSVIPYIGKFLVIWIWGGFSVRGPTLTRFFSLHFLIPLFSFVLVFIHLIFLHEKGSSSIISSFVGDKILFNFYYRVKDIITLLIIILILIVTRIFSPLLFGDPENFNQANPLSTPLHIQPEWYFLFAYAILRSIPSKLGGAIALLLSIFVFYFLIFRNKKNSSIKFIIIEKINIYIFLLLVILLTWIGANPVESPIILFGQIFRFLYFIRFSIFL